jgi:hypothetical protein
VVIYWLRPFDIIVCPKVRLRCSLRGPTFILVPLNTLQAVLAEHGAQDSEVAEHGLFLLRRVCSAVEDQSLLHLQHIAVDMSKAHPDVVRMLLLLGLLLHLLLQSTL